LIFEDVERNHMSEELAYIVECDETEKRAWTSVGHIRKACLEHLHVR
jgi:hypothetical protein